MQRAASTVLGVLLLTALAVALAGAAGLAVVRFAPGSTPTGPVELAVDVDAGDDATRLVLRHRSGPTLDVRTLRIHITVAGTPLPHQPAVPFYSSRGFGSFPSGPFNPAADPHWERGEEAALVLTGDNLADFAPGVAVRVEVYRGDRPVARAEASVD